MAGLDTSAGNVALGQLSALPFKNIIGGPLTAAIEAQALAAKTTVDFIRAVGLQEVNGRFEAVNIQFTYQDSAGLFRRLTVPLLTVIPIPFIVIDTVDISFKARIAASAQQSSEDSSASETKIAGSASWRGWGARIAVSASYSAKKDSKASQDSKYSVEYTMDVAVHASQSGLPQGMAQILNMLQDGITNTPERQINVFGLPGSVSLNGTLAETFTVVAVDDAGEVPATYKISVAFEPPVLKTTTQDVANPATLALAEDKAPKTFDQDVTVTITATSTADPTNTITTTRLLNVSRS
jgi:hypothetical protein